MIEAQQLEYGHQSILGQTVRTRLEHTLLDKQLYVHVHCSTSLFKMLK